MDPDLENVIRQTLPDAKAAGKDHLSQSDGPGGEPIDDRAPHRRGPGYGRGSVGGRYGGIRSNGDKHGRATRELGWCLSVAARVMRGRRRRGEPLRS